MSRFVERLAAELAELVVEAGHDCYADEVRGWLEHHGRGNAAQLHAASRVAVANGWIVDRGQEGRRTVWGAPETANEAEGAA